MKKQRGQSVVEFAFIVPMFALFLFGLIYGGIMFLEYLNLCNDARAEARRVAVMSREQLDTFFKVSSPANYPTETNPTDLDTLKRNWSFYNVTPKIWVETKTDEDTNKTTLEDVVVEVEFERDNDDLPNVLNWMGWPPEKLRPLYYRMRIEQDIVISSGEAANT